MHVLRRKLALAHAPESDDRSDHEPSICDIQLPVEQLELALAAYE